MDDLIDRQAAIDAAKKLLDYYGTNDISKEFADHTAERFMNRVPSAQPERKKGKWIITKTERGWNCAEYPTEVTCSNCNYIEDYQKALDFCPNCGAEMRGEA